MLGSASSDFKCSSVESQRERYLMHAALLTEMLSDRQTVSCVMSAV